MPATLTRSHPAPLLPSVTFSVSDLSNGERAVALYASDMPLRFMMQPGTETTVAAWILQGAARLGLAELHRSAAYAYGYRLLWLANWTTPEQDQAHKQRFPDARRWDRAERLASTFTVWGKHSMMQAAKERGLRPLVEGACRCGGTGWIDTCFDPDDPTTAVSMNCPGHNPGGCMPRPVVIA
ncbi:hypothetical protein [Streptomyces sp. NPDC094031]|uniref:hypothetical protein n=1 Tax=Streptomyces sp. NPDC094031 TaxID=3155307 RepID=UPI0033343AFF